MKKTTTLLTLTLLALACCHVSGMIDQTAEEMYPHLKPIEVAKSRRGVMMEWKDKTLRHTVFFEKGVSVTEFFIFNDNRVMSTKDFDRLLKPYMKFKVGKRSVKERWCQVLKPDGSVFAIIMWPNIAMGNQLSIWRGDQPNAAYKQPPN